MFNPAVSQNLLSLNAVAPGHVANDTSAHRMQPPKTTRGRSAVPAEGADIPLEVVLLAVRELIHLLLGHFDLHLVAVAHDGWLLAPVRNVSTQREIRLV